jgi:hypothetical protein
MLLNLFLAVLLRAVESDLEDAVDKQNDEKEK